MNCAQCRQTLNGRFLRVGNLAFHPEHFLCKICQTPIQGTFNTHQGMFLHPECFASHYAPRCTLCEKALTGKYVAHEGKPYHEACYGKHLAVPCAVCKRMIVGAFIKDYWGNQYHAAHIKEFGACLYCGKLTHAAISGGGTTYLDGRVVCRHCHKSAVHRESDALRVVQRVRQKLQGWGVDLGDIEAPVRMIDRTQLMRFLNGGPHSAYQRVSGFAQMNWERQGRQSLNKRANIYLLSGMPLGFLEAIAAHELMHVWNFHHGPPHTFALEEGSCNYMSYRVHEEQAASDPLAAYHVDCLIRDADPAYGVGFRKVKRYVERHGFERLLALLKRSADFPLLDALF
jgi:hypothetical protein